jgi:hypothetical protein
MIHCSIHCFRNSLHVSKLFTGFALLREAGAVTLSQECLVDDVFDMSKPQHLSDARLAYLLVVVNGTVKLYYDNHDSDEIDADAAEDVDSYFNAYEHAFGAPRDSIPKSLVQDSCVGPVRSCGQVRREGKGEESSCSEAILFEFRRGTSSVDRLENG